MKDLISIGGSFVVQKWFILGMKMLRSNGVKISWRNSSPTNVSAETRWNVRGQISPLVSGKVKWRDKSYNDDDDDSGSFTAHKSDKWN